MRTTQDEVTPYEGIVSLISYVTVHVVTVVENVGGAIKALDQLQDKEETMQHKTPIVTLEVVDYVTGSKRIYVIVIAFVNVMDSVRVTVGIRLKKDALAQERGVQDKDGDEVRGVAVKARNRKPNVDVVESDAEVVERMVFLTNPLTTHDEQDIKVSATKNRVTHGCMPVVEKDGNNGLGVPARTILAPPFIFVGRSMILTTDHTCSSKKN